MHNLFDEQPENPYEVGAINESAEEDSVPDQEAVANSVDDNRAMELAIIGMAGRFPGAANIDEFWQNLADGVESISFYSDEEVAATGVDPATSQDPHYVKAGGYLDGVENFDAGFFNIYPREAAIMDPQHRVFLEVAWEALENAGYNPEIYPGWIGLFAGMGMNTYLMFNLLPNRDVMESVHGYQLTISSDKDFLPTRVSYKFNLRGPSVNVQTACSTSLVAVHLACQSLLSYQCDMALAGGVSIRLPQKTGYLYQEGGITSPDGHCRAFDADAAGTVSGNGAGVVLIKRLTEAVRDGDTIYAIIKGSAINNDGSLKVGYTAPSVDGQAEVISMAQAIANVSPETITYVETHGTGTALGDPIEIAALTQVFRAGSQEDLPNKYCAIGSVKTNVGHLDAAAGVTSLIKTALALDKRQIPPSLHFNRPNPKIDFENGPFYVNTRLRDWEANGFPRRAGISSFGIGGTNVHLILEEAAALNESKVDDDQHNVAHSDADRRRWKLMLLSARSPSALDRATDHLAAHLVSHPEISLADAAYTLQVGRKPFYYRRMLVCQEMGEAGLALETRDPQRVFSGRPRENSGRSSGNSSAIRAVEYSRPQIVFMFSGQGAQYVNMGRDLYDSEEVFRDQVDLCAAILQDHLGQDIRQVIFSNPVDTVDDLALPRQSPSQLDESESTAELHATSQALMQTAITQPALFVIEYALAKLFIHWGIEPEAMIGHSIGEYVAGCLAGVFSLEDALALVAARGRLMQQVAPGAMVSVPLSEAEIQAYLRPGLSLSAVNAPSLCVISGNFEAIEALTYRLANDAIEYRRLRTSHAFHSEMMDEILDDFYQEVARIQLTPPKIPFISNVSGTWISPEQATDPFYWVRHLRQTVRFGLGIAELLKDPAWTFVEVGPGQTLVQLARSVLTAWAASQGRPIDERVLLPTLRPPRNTQPDQEFLLNSLGRLWLAGVDINWNAYHGFQENGEASPAPRKRIPLPTYPFEHKRYWVEPDVPLARLLAGGGASTTAPGSTGSGLAVKQPIKKSANLETWFYTPSWTRSLDLHRIYTTSRSHGQGSSGDWLVFSPARTIQNHGINEFVPMLKKYLPVGSELIEVLPGNAYVRVDDYHYQIDPDNPVDYSSLLSDLLQAGHRPIRIVNCWSLDGERSDSEFLGLADADSQSFRHMPGFFSLLNFVKACDQQTYTQSIQVELVTSGAYEITGDEVLYPAQVPGIALCKVISQEYPNITCRNIDLIFSVDQRSLESAAEAIAAELSLQPVERFVAYRGRHRWVQTFSRAEPQAHAPESPLPIHMAGSEQARKINPNLRQGGVYLITGGLGRIGLALAEYLAGKTQARLVLCDTIEFPPRPTWETWLLEHGSNDPISIRINRLLALEAIGAQIFIVQVDIAQTVAFEQAFRLAQEHFGVVNGIVHAAGIVGDAAIKPLAETSIGDINIQFAPKVLGLIALHEVIHSLPAHERPDFIFLQSSLSTVLGGLGLGGYAAANATMDLYASLFDGEGETAWIRVDWDGWRFDPVTDTPANSGITQRKELELTMTPFEGIQVFELALDMASQGIHHLVISVADLSTRIDQWVTHIHQGTQNDWGSTLSFGREDDANFTPAPETGSSSNSFTRPELQTAYVAPRNSLESEVAHLWEKVLGITPVGIYDDFFELGGHSLLATQLVTRLRDTLRVELPLRRLFESPTIASLAMLIEEFRGTSNENTGQVEGTVEGQVGLSASYSSSITRVNRAEFMPLSFGQQRLWFIDQFEPGSPLYNNFAALRLTGELNLQALNFCLQAIIDRHENLRTTFTEKDGEPVQVIHPMLNVVVETIVLPAEWIHSSPEERNIEISRLAIWEASQPFSLQTGPLLRVKVLETQPGEHVLFLTMHHIVSDGWSVAVLVAEVGALYSAFINKKSGTQTIDVSAILPILPVQYADYAVWQRQLLQGERLESQLDYWRKKLAGNQTLELFTDYPRPTVQTWHGASRWFEIPKELSNRLVGLSQQEGATLFMTLLAAFQILLMHHSGQEDISVGTPIANRTHTEVESLIGFILNTLVLRTDCSGNPEFRQFLGRVRDTALGAYAHQDLPFEMLVEALQPQRDMSRAPFFQVIFDLQQSPLQALALPGLIITPIPIDSGTAKFDLALSMEETIRGKDHFLTGYLNYNTDLFEANTIERMLTHFQVLLEGIASHPEELIWQLPLIGEAELQELSTVQQPVQRNLEPIKDLGFSAESRGKTTPRLIHELISRQAKETPSAAALSLITGNADSLAKMKRLSYQELDERASRVASYLSMAGVGPETIVGLCMNRSVELIIGMLGILKAGGAFLPLDPSYPVERLGYMLEDSQALIVLTHRSLFESNPGLVEFISQNDLKVVMIDGETADLYSYPDIAESYPRGVDAGSALLPEARTKKPGLNNLAYIIYTSGSTGKPKGVMITHQAIAGHCVDMANHFQISPQDHVLQFASLNFDAGLEQVFTSLISGAWLFLRDDDVWPPDKFQEHIDNFVLSVVNVPPAYWQPWIQFVAQRESDPMFSQIQRSAPSLRLVIIGGDIMSLDTLKIWWKTSLHRVRLLNAYGPTETTITATTYQVPEFPSDGLSGSHYTRIPIGSPHLNRTAYILNRHGGLTPYGIPGELHLGGSYLSRGYLNQPELTTEKFISDPFTHGKLVYKTGDLVRWLPDGNLDFLGRVDQQVKLRGFRIELGEIEAVISAHPDVVETTVVIHHEKAADSGGEKQLVAFVTLATGQPFEPNGIYEFIKTRLPAYMIPAVFIAVGNEFSTPTGNGPVLESLPLTPSGKVDRKALSSIALPAGASGALQKMILPPRSPLEKEILDIWDEVLGRPADEQKRQISIDDNFFELGGHSLLATQIVSRIRQKYQIDLPLRELFENPTIIGISELIVQSLSAVSLQQTTGAVSLQDDVDEIELLLAELEQMSEDEARELLADDRLDPDDLTQPDR